jgi:threonine dehydratase
LLAGTALTVKGRSPSTRVIGAEPKAADDALRSLLSGTLQPSNDPKTMADGLRTSLGERPFSIIRQKVDAIVTATEPEILDAMRFVWERFKMIIEPSCAVPVAPVFNGSLAVQGLRVGIIITGGNVDLEPMFQALAAKWL